jgi:hypothetical protein
MAPVRISCYPNFITRWLGLVACLLVIASTVTTAYRTWLTNIYSPVTFFYLDSEINIPTFFSSCLLLFAALLLFVISLVEKYRSPSLFRYWQVLVFVFSLMALDEFTSLHERLISPVRRYLGGGRLGIFYFAWIIPAMIIVIVFILLIWKFLANIQPKMRSNFIMAAATYLGGCIGFEMVGGHYAEAYGMLNWTYHTIVTCEESLEMMGVIILIWGLLTYLAENYQAVSFQVERRSSIVDSYRHSRSE